MNQDIEFILEKIHTQHQSQKTLLDTQTRISDFKKSIEKLDDDEEKTKQKISDFKSGDNYSKYLDAQKKLDSHIEKKHEIKDLIDIQFTKISRPLGRYEYVSSLEKQEKILLGKLVNNPFDVLTLANKDIIIKILSSVHKGVEGGSISVKDSTKALSSINETIEALDDFISKISQFNDAKNNIEKDLGVFNINELKQNENLLSKISTEKIETTSRIQKLDGEISEITKKLPQIIMDIEVKLQNVTSTKYHIIE